MLLPPGGRVSLIHVDDLARLLLALAANEETEQLVLEPDDGRPEGWSHKELAIAIGEAVGRRNLSLSMPSAMLRFGARVDQFLRRERAKLSPDRAAYFSHRDWVVDASRRPLPALWLPQVETEHGLARTAEWYRDEGWL